MRGLKVLVVVMGILIVAGTLGLVVALVQKLGGGGAVPTTSIALRQPAGTTIMGIAPTEGGLAIWVRDAGGERVLLVDPRQGRVAGQIKVGE